MTKTLLRIERAWAMPNRWTFSIAPIARLLDDYVHDGTWVDPFCGQSELALIHNDIAHKDGVDAREFLSRLDSIPNCLLDPPYSPRQIERCYKAIGREVTRVDTQNARLYAEVKNLVAERMPIGGQVIGCGWNSTGMGKKRGYRLVRVLLVNHGAAHNDTIVTVEHKIGAGARRKRDA